ncbi:MAG: pyruvate ferredoxin oxidoreductase [Acidobacteria bacterium]|nr:pyruvate ferredoxin oxidoreductase [Acidobacteriota bacterium]
MTTRSSARPTGNGSSPERPRPIQRLHQAMDSYEIRLCGTGGQGLILAGRILADAVVREGRWVAQSQAFEPLSRGGVSQADLVISSSMVDFPLVSDLDFLLVLDELAVAGTHELLTPASSILLDSERVATDVLDACRPIRLPLVETARTLGNLRAANMVALGALVALTDVCQRDSLEAAMLRVSPKGFQQINQRAIEVGCGLGAESKQPA